MKDRADKVMADRGLVSSRSQAKCLIEKGDVSINGSVLKKAGELIESNAEIIINAPLFVGRGAFKLQRALEEFKVNVKDRTCVDIGASTGGFTEVLLMAGAKKVYAIDVGHGQLAEKLVQDSRVVNMENTNVRDLPGLPEPATLAVMDLSFISITKVLRNVSSLLALGADLLVLIKPQFEIGKESLPKDGVVKDEALRGKVLEDVLDFARSQGWHVVGTVQSPIEGKSGNVEYLSHFIKG